MIIRASRQIEFTAYLCDIKILIYNVEESKDPIGIEREQHYSQ